MTTLDYFLLVGANLTAGGAVLIAVLALREARGLRRELIASLRGAS